MPVVIQEPAILTAKTILRHAGASAEKSRERQATYVSEVANYFRALGLDTTCPADQPETVRAHFSHLGQSVLVYFTYYESQTTGHVHKYLVVARDGKPSNISLLRKRAKAALLLPEGYTMGPDTTQPDAAQYELVSRDGIPNPSPELKARLAQEEAAHGAVLTNFSLVRCVYKYLGVVGLEFDSPETATMHEDYVIGKIKAADSGVGFLKVAAYAV